MRKRPSLTLTSVVAKSISSKPLRQKLVERGVLLQPSFRGGWLLHTAYDEMNDIYNRLGCENDDELIDIIAQRLCFFTPEGLARELGARVIVCERANPGNFGAVIVGIRSETMMQSIFSVQLMYIDEDEQKKALTKQSMARSRMVASAILCDQPRVCIACHTECSGVLACASCHISYYCSSECQLEHLSTHEMSCDSLRGFHQILQEVKRVPQD